MTSGRSIAILFAVTLAVAACGGKEPAPAATPEAAATQAATQTAPTPTGSPAGAGDAGETVYRTYCVTCHGSGGKGDGVAAAGLNPKPADFSVGAFRHDANGNGVKGEIDDIKAVVRDGAARHGGSPLMAPWPMLSPEQLQAVAEHVKSLHAG